MQHHSFFRNLPPLFTSWEANYRHSLLTMTVTDVYKSINQLKTDQKAKKMRNLRLSGQMGSLLNRRYPFYRLHEMSCWFEVKGHDSCRRKLLFDIKVLPLWNKWHFYLSTQDSLCATGCADGVIRLFDLKSGRCLRFDSELIYLLVMFRILRQKEKPTYLLRAL